MPFALLIVGLVLIVAGVRNTVEDNGTQKGLITLVKGDFTGNNNFTYWLVSILIVGSIGYISDLRKLSRAFLTLIIIGLLFSNKGFFTKFQQQVFGTFAPASLSGANLLEPSTSGLTTLL